MGKRRAYLAVSVVTVLVSISVFVLKRPPLRWYVVTALKPCELPQRLIRPCFLRITDQELPQRMDNARALFLGGVDSGIFVRFQTDTEGIRFVCDAFGKPRADIETVDSHLIKAMTESGAHIFYVPFQWEEKTGITLFDQKSVESGRMLRYLGPPGSGGYTVFIDDRNSAIYIHAFR
jgi:hypothetical protein